MFHKLLSRKGAMAAASVALGLSGMSLALASPAGATGTYTAGKSSTLITGSGSQTAYAVMASLTTLFNEAAGCDFAASTSVPNALNCGTSSTAGPTITGTPGSYTIATPGNVDGEQGFPVSGLNPYNDYAANLPATSSGSGRAQLNGGTATDGASATYNVFEPSYARTSSFSTASPANTAMNYVKYATDGVSWTTFSKANGVATAQAKVKTLTQAQITAIWNNTLTCTVSGVTYTMNWKCVGATKSAPIDCYQPQNGSGTAGTWASFAGYSVSGTATAPCTGNEAGDTTESASAAVASHTNLFENQMAQVGAASDAADAIYFMSFGKWNTTCTGIKSVTPSYTALCAGTPTTDTTVFGGIGGVQANQASVQGSGGGAGVTFPVTRGLYNVYNNSSATGNQVPASQATLNFVGENGFLCRPETSAIVNPVTGNSFRFDIEAAIKSQGFFPLDVSGSPFTYTAPTYEGVLTGVYAGSLATAQDTVGYCLPSNG